MANYTINTTPTISTLGDVDIYIGGKTSTTLIDAKIMDVSDIIYDFSNIDGVFYGKLVVKLSNIADAVYDQHDNIMSQIWLVEVGGVEYFRGYPQLSSIVYQKTAKADYVNITIGADLLDPSGVNFSGLTLYGGEYSLSDVLEEILSTNGITSVNYINSSTGLIYELSESDTIDIYFDKNDAGGGDSFITVQTSADFSPLQITNDFGINYCAWKGEAYFWLRNEASTSIALTESVAVNSIVRKKSYLNRGYFDNYRGGINVTNSGFSSRGISSRYANEVLSKIDKFMQFSTSNYAATNWSTTVGGLNQVGDSESDPFTTYYDTKTVYFGTDIINFNIYSPSDTLNILLDRSDFETDVNIGDSVVISADIGALFPYIESTAGDFTTYLDSIDFTLYFDATNTATTNLNIAREENLTPDNNGYIESEQLLEDVGDLILSFGNITGNILNEDGTYASMEVPNSPNVYTHTTGGGQTFLALETTGYLRTNYVNIAVPSQPSFDGYYELMSATDIGGGRIRHQITNIGQPVNAVVRAATATMPIRLFVANLEIGITTAEYDEKIDYSVDSGKYLAPNYESSTVDESRELQYLIGEKAVSSLESVFGNEEKNSIEMSVKDGSVNPYNKIEYDSITYSPIKYGFSIKNGIAKITGVEA
ncbi:MAG: hypothetical protein ACRBG0_27730 [Lewinella sp.]|uniref:hypothetical protein n=1 Tax=Lewinella sp. TaxID=2004506 RepID=UPI003D6AFC5C